METVVKYTLATLVNVIGFFVMQVMAKYIYFLLFNKGGFNVINMRLVCLFFVLIQIAILFFLYRKKYLFNEKLLLVINVLFTVGLYFIFIVFNVMDKLA